jgi:MFS family permease
MSGKTYACSRRRRSQSHVRASLGGRGSLGVSADVSALPPAGGDHRGFGPAVGMSLSAYTVAVLPVFLIGALANQMRDELRFDEFALGIAVASFWTAAAVGSTWLGRFSEGIGAGPALQLGAFVDGVALMSVAVLARSWSMLTVCMALCGVANALIQPAVSLLLARSVPVARRGTAFGLTLAAIPLSTLIGGVAVPTVALTVGWRWAFVGASVLATASGVAARSKVSAGSSSVGGNPVIDRSRRPRLERGSDAPVRVLIVLGIAAALAAAATGSLGAFLVQGATRIGIAENLGGWLLAAGSVAALGARLALGVMADRRRGEVLHWAAIMLLGGAACIVALASAHRALYVIATLGAFALAWGWPGLFNLAIVQIAPKVPGFATGIALTGTYLGGVIGPPAFGALAQNLSYAWAWSCAGLWTLAAGVVMLIGEWTVTRLRS